MADPLIEYAVVIGGDNRPCLTALIRPYVPPSWSGSPGGNSAYTDRWRNWSATTRCATWCTNGSPKRPPTCPAMNRSVGSP